MDATNMVSINHWHDRFFKTISIIGGVLILFVLTIILLVGQASSYEFSIYDAYPWYFWVFLLSAITCGQVVIIGSGFTPTQKDYWLFGLCTILISDALLLFLPFIRGYYIYGSGDVLTHIGYMKDILHTSSIGGNHYPIDHILGISLHLISGLSLPDITLIFPPFFSFFFILSMYIVGKTIFQNKKELLILISLSTILMWGNGHLAFSPNSQAFFIVPLLLYLAFKMYYGENIQKYQLLLLLISLLLVLYHPLVTIMVTIILCIMQIVLYIQEKIQEKNENRNLMKVNYVYSIVFILIMFSIWSTYLEIAFSFVKPIFERIFGEGTGQSELQQSIGIISQVNVDPLYLIKLILNFLGQSILLGILSLLCMILILISLINHKTRLTFYKGVAIMGFYVFFMFAIAMLISNGNFGFTRIYDFATIFSLILIPTGVYLFLNNNPNSGKTVIKLLGIIFIFFLITNFSTFNLYFSPIVKEANLQVPVSNYFGMNTFFSYRDESLPILELGLVSTRFYDAIFGYSAPRPEIEYDRKNVLPPNHFGYQNETILGNFYNNSKYVLVNDQARRLNPYMNPEFENKWSFSPKDFERIKMDSRIDQVYSNKDLEIFFAPGIAGGDY
jgi:hypothetical protein